MSQSPQQPEWHVQGDDALSDDALESLAGLLLDRAEKTRKKDAPPDQGGAPRNVNPEQGDQNVRA